MGIDDKVRNFLKGPCVQLIHYDSQKFDFSGIKGIISAVEVDIGAFKTEMEKIRDVSNSAAAVDRLQYYLCRQEHELKDNDPRRKRLFDMRTSILTSFTYLQILADTKNENDKHWNDSVDELYKNLNDLLEILKKDMIVSYTPSDLGSVRVDNLISSTKNFMQPVNMPDSIHTLHATVSNIIKSAKPSSANISFHARPETVQEIKKITSKIKRISLKSKIKTKKK